MRNVNNAARVPPYRTQPRPSRFLSHSLTSSVVAWDVPSILANWGLATLDYHDDWVAVLEQHIFTVNRISSLALWSMNEQKSDPSFVLR